MPSYGGLPVNATVKSHSWMLPERLTHWLKPYLHRDMPTIAKRVALLSATIMGCLLSAEPLRVGVSVIPLESLVKSVGGEAVTVQSLQREGDSCSVFEPRPSAISWLAGAELFFRVGAAYESVILQRLALQFPDLKVSDLRDAVDTIPVTGHHHHDHDHGEHACADCATEELQSDPHIWLDPVYAGQLVEAISRELSLKIPQSGEAIGMASGECSGRLQGIHTRLTELLQPHKGRGFYIYHPSLGYFARRYGLKQVPISSGSHGPGPRELQRLIREAREAGIKTVFVQPQESRKHAEIVARAIGARLVEIDPLAPDVEANLLRIGAALAESFGHD